VKERLTGITLSTEAKTVMDRRRFLKWSAVGTAGLTKVSNLMPWYREGQLLETRDQGSQEDNPNWATSERGASVNASSWKDNPPWGFVPANVFGENLNAGWETDKETTGAWLELDFPETRIVREFWILSRPLPYGIVLDPYMRGGDMAMPRQIVFNMPGKEPARAELRQADYFQIIKLPSQEQTRSLRISIENIWPESDRRGTGLGKIQVFPRLHRPDFEVTVYATYDVQHDKAVQAATLQILNPQGETAGGHLQISRQGAIVASIPLAVIPKQSVTCQDVWIPAPFADEEMEFSIVSKDEAFQSVHRLKVPAYRSYFDGGTFNFLCTNHNDLGWLDTQEVTADYRSAELILPAMRLLRENPEYRYCMESVVYLIEFLERHPEKRDEMAQLMKEGLFTWGGSYVQCLEVHVGPEKLVRQFYLGRRWLKKNFPGADSRYYFKTDPPSMTLQMPQILRKAGIKYIVQARFPWGFYYWESPDGSRILLFADRYADPRGLLNPKSNKGWLSYAALREPYYTPRRLPPIFIYDHNGDYLPPCGDLIAYARQQNDAMRRFAAKWNNHYAGDPQHQIKPPNLRFVEPEAILDEVSRYDLDVETVRGEWPMNWAYYDEPSNREALLLGRLGHNKLLMAERLWSGLELLGEKAAYPQKVFSEAWQANCWPDHGWGGNRGTLTDKNYADSYRKAAGLAEKLLADSGSAIVQRVPRRTAGRDQLPVVVFNPLPWTRKDVVRLQVKRPSGWPFFSLRDDSGHSVDCQVSGREDSDCFEIFFVGEKIPSLGYRTYYLESSSRPPDAETPLTGDSMENNSLRIALGPGGLSSLYDKRLHWEVLQTEKFGGGEVVQFTAPGQAWEDPALVTMEDFDQSRQHPFSTRSFLRGSVRSTSVREAKFRRFLLRQHVHLYHQLDRLEMEVEILGWDGQKNRELRVAFPLNMEKARLSYEAPFGTVEVGKDEADFSMLPLSPDTQWRPEWYGGNKPLPFREAINWIDASSQQFQGMGCLLASDSTLHLFIDQTSNPVSYPVLQHVLLSTRKSLAWNPEYWFTQEGNHRYRMALYPHAGNWRLRYRDGIAFNYPLFAFVGSQETGLPGAAFPSSAEWLRLEPANLVLTALKKSEDDDSLILRLYEAEGRPSKAKVRLHRPVKQAFVTNLIEEEPEQLPVKADGVVEFMVKAWEIVTVKLIV
jgi:alpha-mannosidase